MERCFKKWTHETAKKDGSIEPCAAENDESTPSYRFYIYIYAMSQPIGCNHKGHV